MDLVCLCKQNPSVANIGNSHHSSSKRRSVQRKRLYSPPALPPQLSSELITEDVALAHCMAKKATQFPASRACCQPAFQNLLKIFL